MRDPTQETRYVGVGAAVVVSGYLFSPVLQTLDHASLTSAAIYSASALLMFYQPRAQSKRTMLAWQVVGLFAAVLAVTTVARSVIRADQNQDANDRRCLAIQRDMLSAHPHKPDGPALFQAFGCRPQGEGSAYAPPTDRELRAGRPLDNGGYLPPK